MKGIIKELRLAATATLVLVIIVCCLYPCTVWMLAQLLFPYQANGSLLIHEGRVVGSQLIGQQFTDKGFFHPRPSAAGQGYDAASSGGSNLGPLSQKLINSVSDRVRQYRSGNNLAPSALVPADAVTASGSGLDPHISVQNALLQAPRVAGARGMSLESVQNKIKAHTEGGDLLLFREPRVNVLMLNIALAYNK